MLSQPVWTSAWGLGSALGETSHANHVILGPCRPCSVLACQGKSRTTGVAEAVKVARLSPQRTNASRRRHARFHGGDCHGRFHVMAARDTNYRLSPKSRYTVKRNKRSAHVAGRHCTVPTSARWPHSPSARRRQATPSRRLDGALNKWLYSDQQWRPIPARMPRFSVLLTVRWSPP